MYALVLAASSMMGQVMIEQNCPGGVCPVQSQVFIQPSTIIRPSKILQATPDTDSRYVWIEGSSKDQYLLKRDGKVIGQYWVPDHNYHPWDGKKVLAACKPPIDPPSGANGFTAATIADWQISGVHADKLGSEEVVTFGGTVIGKHKMEDAFNGKLTDDSSKGYFLIVAKDDGKRNKVLGDWMKLPEDFRARYHLWMADPNHFTMQDRYNGKPRFFTEGDPSVILQNSSGEVLFRRPQAGQVYQQADMQELLKSDPAYNPNLDPGSPQKTLTDYLPKLSAQQWGYAGFGAVALVIFLKRRKS